MEDSEKLSATLTGIAVGAAAHLVRQQSQTDDRIDRNRDDVTATRRELREFKSNGHIVRDTMPTVADLLSGVAMAHSESATPTLLPNLNTVSRPALLSLIQSAVADFKWPPSEGTYSENGYITKAGELTSLGLVLTYEEVRAFLHGLVLGSAPSQAQKLQTLFASSGLIQAITEQSYTAAQWVTIWKSLLGGGVQTTPAPTITSQPGPFTAILLNGAKNEAMNIKVTVTGNINSGTPIAKIKFGTNGVTPAYSNIPAVVVGSGLFQIDNLNNLEFTLTNRVAFVNGDTPIPAIVVGSCDAD